MTFSRGDAAATDTTAALVPAGALAYVHLSTADSRTQDTRLREVAGRFTAVAGAIPKLAALITPGAASLNFDRDVRPWLGDDAAVAITATGAPMLVASVHDRAAAEQTLAKLGATPAGSYKGASLRALKPHATAALAGGHLVVGPDTEVRAAIDRDAGHGTPALSTDREFRRVSTSREGGASLDAYLTSAALRRVLDGRTGLAGVAGQLVAGPTLQGLDATVTAEETGLRVRARILRTPGAKRPVGYTPTLADRVPADAAGFVSVPGLDAAADVLSRLGAGKTMDAIAAALPDAAGVELEDLIAPLADEAQLTVMSGTDAPVFTVAARTRSEASTRDGLARLQGPLGDRLAGGAPFDEIDHQGTKAFALPVTDLLEPTYAIAHGDVVASTARSGLDQLAPAKRPVTEDTALKEVMPSGDAKVEALGFLDSRQLLALAERTGLKVLSSPAARDDLGRIRSAGAVVEEDADHPTDTTAELFLEIP